MNPKTASDHDLLIRLDTKVDGVIGSLSELKDGTQKRLANLELRMETAEKKLDEYGTARRVILAMAAGVGGVFGAIATIIATLVNFRKL